MTLAVGLAGSGEACGSANVTPKPTGTGQLTGSVLVCRAIGQHCSPIAATVTVHSVQGKTFGKRVAQRYAVNGRFNFSLPPGKYFPSASQARIDGHRCISGAVALRAHVSVRDDILCYPRVRKSAT
jgi:hypothetical protein